MSVFFFFHAPFLHNFLVTDAVYIFCFPKQWFHSLPIITKFWFGTTLILTLAGNFGILSPYYYIFKWEGIVKEFQVWRVATCFCYAGGFDLNTLIAMYMLVNFSKQYENSGPFNTGAGGKLLRAWH